MLKGYYIVRLLLHTYKYLLYLLAFLNKTGKSSTSRMCSRTFQTIV